MSLKTRFVISLIVILLLSWADVFFAGTQGKFPIPDLLRHAVHFIALMFTLFIGYLNWKDYPEKWLASIWLMVYGLMIIVLVSAAGSYFLKLPYSTSYLHTAIYLRNRFTSPLIFIIWYMLHLMSGYLVKGKS